MSLKSDNYIIASVSSLLRPHFCTFRGEIPLQFSDVDLCCAPKEKFFVVLCCLYKFTVPVGKSFVVAFK
ncbi:hypothetical protein K7X08_029559 [Anisodus acutangulus]|uniref:Uncharacterized protein n=1 Tax=Anisodus acutangulus TaxID=402998 RepID=A0A9Q1L2H8_9SOLA|nr:hypothetical protein K7X08_029559 [Anisodus acutangulus]